MKIIRKQLSEIEGLPPNIRWDETCECVQTTWDGETWVDTPGADPRYNPGNLAPPNDTSDPRCSAAAGMRDKIEQVMNAFFLADALIDAANAVFAVILIFNPPASLLWRIVFAICEALYAIGTAALVAAFTPEAYDELQCIFYNNIGEDGQMSAAQLSDVNTQICDEMDVTVCAAMGLILNMLGWVGMSNAGALFGADSDCSECVGCDPATCTVFDFEVSDQGFVTHNWSGGDFQGGVYWTSGSGFPDGWLAQTEGGFNKLGLESHCDCIRADTVKVTTFTSAGANAQLSIRISRHDDNTQLALKNFFINPTGAGSAVSESTWDIGGFVNEEDIDIEIGVKSTSGYGFMVTKLELIETP